MQCNVSLVDFTSTIYTDLNDGEVVCIAKPSNGGFSHYPATERKLKQIERSPGEYYICVSSVAAADPLRRRKSDCRCVYVMMLDDIGTKVDAPGLAPSAILETSEANYQYLYFLDPFDLHTDDDIRYFEACNRAIANAGFGDTGSQGVNRIYRLPGSINTKEGRDNWRTRVTFWQPDRSWSLESLMAELDLKPEYKEVNIGQYGGEVPPGFSDCVLEWLQEQGLLGEQRDDFFDVKCPWADAHTTGKDTAGYSPLGYGRPAVLRGFHCFHSHCEHRTATDFLAWIQGQGGPGVGVSGIAEIEADTLKEETRQYTQTERVTVLYASLPTIWKKNLPDVVYTANGALSASQRPTRRNVQYLVDALGVRARMNMQTRKPEFAFHEQAINELIDHEAEVERAVLDAGQLCGLGGVAAELLRITQEMALNDRYHPMAEWVLSAPWDGKSRFSALAGSVGVEDAYRDIWPRYLKRWLIQGVQAVMGWADPQQMRGCLVIAGAQNIGKSRWFGSLVPPGYFLEGAHIELHGGAAKDSIMQTTAYSLVELGELETTFSKSATGQLKAFLATRKDVYRAPYDTKAREWPRCTSFCATVNKRDFLIDETGSTRYWPVWADTVNVDHGIDMQQLWAEVYGWWAAGEPWWLDEAESNSRAAQSEVFEVDSNVKEQTMDWLLNHKWPGRGMNATQFAQLIDVSPNKPNLSTIRGLLDKNLGPRKSRVKGVQNGWDVPVTPGFNVKINGKMPPAD